MSKKDKQEFLEDDHRRKVAMVENLKAALEAADAMDRFDDLEASIEKMMDEYDFAKTSETYRAILEGIRLFQHYKKIDDEAGLPEDFPMKPTTLFTITLMAMQLEAEKDE